MTIRTNLVNFAEDHIHQGMQHILGVIKGANCEPQTALSKVNQATMLVWRSLWQFPHAVNLDSY